MSEVCSPVTRDAFDLVLGGGTRGGAVSARVDAGVTQEDHATPETLAVRAEVAVEIIEHRRENDRLIYRAFRHDLGVARHDQRRST